MVPRKVLRQYSDCAPYRLPTRPTHQRVGCEKLSAAPLITRRPEAVKAFANIQNKPIQINASETANPQVCQLPKEGKADQTRADQNKGKQAINPTLQIAAQDLPA